MSSCDLPVGGIVHDDVGSDVEPHPSSTVHGEWPA